MKGSTHLMWNESPRWLATICSYSSFRYCTMRSIWSCRLSRNNTASSLVTPFISMSFTWFKHVFHCTLTKSSSTRNSLITPPSVFLWMSMNSTVPTNEQRWLVVTAALQICVQEVSRCNRNWIIASLNFQCLYCVPSTHCHYSNFTHTWSVSIKIIYQPTKSMEKSPSCTTRHSSITQNIPHHSHNLNMHNHTDRIWLPSTSFCVHHSQ